MNNLFLLSETFTNGYRAEILDFISLASIICGILVIISKNPIVSVLFLIGLFLSISSYLIILGINFIGLSYLLVYVGAVSILFLFILMLINVIISVAFNYPLYEILPYGISSFNSYIFNLSSSLTEIFYKDNSLFNSNVNLNSNLIDNGEILFVTSKIWDGNLAEISHISTIGNIMYSTYSI